MRGAVLVLAGVSLVSASLPAAAQSTTRIDTGSIYGATVTVEEGVRVIRPLPPYAKKQVSPGSGQPDTCRCNRTYLHRIGDEAGSGRYIRQVGEPRTERGIP
jgi:hypothetical protein